MEACTTSPGATGWTPLLWAASMGHAGVARLLIEAGADAQAQLSRELLTRSVTDVICLGWVRSPQTGRRRLGSTR